MIIAARESYLSSKTSLGVEYLHPVVAGVRYIKVAFIVDVYSQWCVELTSVSSFSAKGIEERPLAVKNFDLIMYPVDDIYVPVLGNCHICWLVEPTS